MTYLGDPKKRKPKNPESELKRLTKGFNEAWKKHSSGTPRLHESITKVKRNKTGRKRQTPRFTV